MAGMWKKLFLPRIWERILRERLGEPLHLNLLSLPVALFGSVPAKIYFDLLVRQQNAFGLYEAALLTKAVGLKSFVAIEFGVAAGAGLINLGKLATRISKATDIDIRVAGFDTGQGMPDPIDYRDHPDLYRPGDYVMNEPALRSILPPNTTLHIGPLEQTIGAFTQSLSAAAPLGYVALDVDYYSSSRAALRVFDGPPENYLPHVLLYLDDNQSPRHTPWQGEWLAVNEFNEQHEMRKIAPYNFLREWRLFKRAVWISQMFAVYLFDHAVLSEPQGRREHPVNLDNPYLKG